MLDKQVLVLGAGGVARTIASGLVRRGAGVTLCARNEEKATALAEALGCRSTTWSMRAGTLCDILINCTPVGMHPDVDTTPTPPAAFKPGMLVFDTVYHPENTMFLKLAREHNCATVSGVEMFVRQAALQFQLLHRPAGTRRPHARDGRSCRRASAGECRSESASSKREHPRTLGPRDLT